jgi:hypothetical protein
LDLEISCCKSLSNLEAERDSVAPLFRERVMETRMIRPTGTAKHNRPAQGPIEKLQVPE